MPSIMPLGNRTVFAIILAFFVCVFAVMGLRRAAAHVGLIDHPGGRKLHGEPVPLLGGVGIIFGMLAGLMVLPMQWPAQQFRAFIAAVGVIGLVGVLDDLHEISAKVKLFFQFLASVLLTSWAGVSLGNLGPVLGGIDISTGAWAVPFTLIACVGLMNAVNMTDGLDGLVGSAAGITLFCIWIIALASDNGALAYAPLIGITLSALVGFLVFNFPYPGRPLRTFLGDTGSLLLGLILTWFAVTLSQTPNLAAPPIVFVWLCGLFLIDFLCIMTQRIVRRRSPLAPDRRHFHHLLQRAGMSATRTLGLLIFVHAAICAAGIFMWRMRWSQSTMLLLAFVILVIALAASLSAARWVPYLRRRKYVSTNR
jgi:UDP-GlcNAc:undecaprenyl-phosphate/decaprenyl-phosphate GlcNAc-1-phosphate transferase